MPLKFAKPEPAILARKAKQREREKNWQRVRMLVLARDGRRCRRCHSRKDVEVHHIKPRALGREDTTRNTCCLCVICHALIQQHVLWIDAGPKGGDSAIRFTEQP